ncbi:hypothetical protein DV738_g1570, partial [Chaetothyriales sp. CBS 135597]
MTAAPSKPKPKPKPRTAAVPSQPKAAPASSRSAPSDDFLSDKATVALIRRVLVSDEASNGTQQPLEAVLPPLTSSNAIDTQLYAILAVVIKDFVQSWYSVITPDRAFTDEIIHTIAHCTRALEQRLRQTDVIALLLDEVPALVEKHMTAYRTATRPQAMLAHRPGPRQIYHSLNPHPALDPNQTPEQQARTAAAYRQLLVQGVLACLLPTEEVQNTSVRILVTDIVADLILRQAVDDKLSDPCFIYNLVSVAVRSASSRRSESAVQEDGRSRLEKFGLLSAQNESASPGSTHTGIHTSTRKDLPSSLPARFWSVLHFVYVSLVAVRFIVLGLLHARQRAGTAPLNSARPKRGRQSSHDQLVHRVLDYRLFSTLATLLKMPSRMPWLLGFLAFCRHLLSASSARPGAFSSLLDSTASTKHDEPFPMPICFTAPSRRLSERKQTARYCGVFNLLAGLNHPSSSQPPVPLDQQPLCSTKHQTDSTVRMTLRMERPSPAALPPSVNVTKIHLLSLIPNPIRQIYYATTSEEEMRQAVEEEVLQVFDDPSMNKHLLYSVIDLIIVTLLPELIDKTPADLLADRGVIIANSSSA